jgi:hypothetical protein
MLGSMRSTCARSGVGAASRSDARIRVDAPDVGARGERLLRHRRSPSTRIAFTTLKVR